MSTRHGFVGAALTALIAITAPPAPSSAWKPDRALKDSLAASDRGPVRVIVAARSGSGAALTDAVAAQGGVVTSAYASPLSVSATVPASGSARWRAIAVLTESRLTPASGA